MSKGRISAADWLVTESVRLYEERHGRQPDDETANVLARETGGTVAERLVRRALALPAVAALRRDLASLRRLLRQLAVLLLVLGTLAGVVAALSSASAREVDVLLAAASLLLLPGLLLIGWVMVITLTRPGTAAPGVGRGLLGFGLRRLGPRMLSGPLAAEAIAANAGLLLSRPGRWLLGTLTHAFWALYSLAALITLTLLFSIAQYDLSWGTTLLTDETVITLIQGLAHLPAWIGLIEPPSAEWILAGRAGQETGAVRAEWARFLLMLVAVYGLLPRLVLLAFCALLASRGLRRMDLDTRRPGYLRLAGTLVADGEVETRGRRPDAADPVQRKRPARATGPPVLIGVELERAEWPPEIPDLTVRALGRADTRAQRAALLAAVESLDMPPPALIAQCSALRTPDEGTARFLLGLAEAGQTALVLWLDELDGLRDRAGELAERQADWRSLAERTGASLVVLDADQPDADALAELQQAAGQAA